MILVLVINGCGSGSLIKAVRGGLLGLVILVEGHQLVAHILSTTEISSMAMVPVRIIWSEISDLQAITLPFPMYSFNFI